MADVLLGPVLIPAILNAGYNFDFIDDRAMETAGIPYKVLVLPGVERIPLATLKRIDAFVHAGGIAIDTRSLPSLGPGLLEEQADSARIAALSHQIFQGGLKNARLVTSDGDAANALKELLPADFATDPVAAPSIGFVHRKLPSAEIYFIANTSNRAVGTTASVRVSGRKPEWWNPFSGEMLAADYKITDGRTSVPLSLAPYESKVLVFSAQTETPSYTKPVGPARTLPAIDLNSDWQVTFERAKSTVTFDRLRSWTEDPATRFYSGRAIYRKTVEISAATLSEATKIVLTFGPGVPIEPALQETPGMHALLDSPVREAAVVLVNGTQAGWVWHPPYELEIKRYLHAGPNVLQFAVGNLAINEMSGVATPSYKLLNLRYGERFVPQDMQGLRPLPSGILGHVFLRPD